MAEQFNRRGFIGAALATAAVGPFAQAQTRRREERDIDPILLPLDKPGVWTLHFVYKPPRIITVPLFDKVKNERVNKTVWYLWYQVYNLSGEPVYFIPAFELVPKDLQVGAILDDPQPYIVDWISRNKEDVDQVLNIQSTISISKKAIPPSKPDAFPRKVSGIAVWTDMAARAPKTNRFSIYIAGLSNGLVKEQSKPVPPKNEVITLIKRKTLRLDFFRPTDDASPPPGVTLTTIRPDERTGPAETWVYRATSNADAAPAPAPKQKPKQE